MLDDEHALLRVALILEMQQRWRLVRRRQRAAGHWWSRRVPVSMLGRRS